MQHRSSRRISTRRFWLFLTTAVVLTGVLVLATGSAVAASLTGSKFEIDTDANLVVDTTGNIDWLAAGTNTLRTDVKAQKDADSGKLDDAFGQGTAEDQAVPTVVLGSIPPNKSDLKYFGVMKEKNATTGKSYLNLFWSRVQDPKGTTNMDFEFNQSQTVSSNGVTPVRTAGDLLIEYHLDNGGSSATLSLREWNGSSWGAETPLTGKAIGSINSSLIAASASDGIGPLDPRTFGEASIDLAAIFPAGQCRSFGSAYLKSRSSDSFTSEIKDYIAPEPVNISNCGTIVVKKLTNPSGSTASFGYTTGGLTPATFNLTDTQTQTFTNVQAGSYTVTEGTATGWDLQSLACVSANNTSTAGYVGPTATINLSGDDTVTCTYTNTQRGTIIVEKQTDPAGATGFTFTGDAAGTINDDGQISVPNLVPGTYSSTESAKSGWDLQSISCNDSDSSGSGSTATFHLQAGETVKCTFNNRARGSISIHKQDDSNPALPLLGAVFTVTPGGATCTTDAAGNCTIGNLIPGTEYTVTETTTPFGYDTAAPQTATPGAGGTVSLTFSNPRRFTVIVLVCQEKNDSNTGVLYPSTVTVDGVTKTSLSTPSTLCATSGARYEGVHYGTHPSSVLIPQ